MQYTQSITSTQPVKISSLTEVTLTQTVNISSLHRSADVPTPFHRLATLVTPTIPSRTMEVFPLPAANLTFTYLL